MAYYKIHGETLTGIAEAIREKNGTADAYNPTDMATAIAGIQTGAAFNIAYGGTAPEDTSGLWVKCDPAAKVKVASRLGAAGEEVEMIVGAIPVATTSMASAAVGTKVYLFGGNTESGETDAIYMWDAENHSISTLAVKLPAATRAGSAVSAGKKIYIFGGYNADTILVFDTETNTIKTLGAKLPGISYRMALAAVGTKVYLFGGQNGSTYTDRICVFDTEAKTIVTLSAKLPKAAGGMTAAVYDTKIYLFGGTQGSAAGGLQDTIQVFDTETNTISMLSKTLPADIGVCFSAAASMGEKVYLFGGRRKDGTSTGAIGVFDMTTHSASALTAALPTETEEPATVAVGTRVYLFGGDCGDYFSAIHMFVAAIPLEENTLLVEASLADHLCKLIANEEKTIEIGISNVYRGNAEGLAERVSAATYQDGAWVEI